MEVRVSSPCALAILGVCVQIAAVVGQANDDFGSLAETVISGIKNNYSHVRTIQAVLEEVSEDASVTKAETKTVKSPSGATLTYEVSPRASWESTVYAKGDQVRRDTTDTSQNRSQMLVYKDGVWTQYIPSSRTAWLRRTDQMPGLAPADLRDTGSPSLRHPLVDILREQDITSAGLGQDPATPGMIQIVTSGPSEEQRFQFDPDYSFLPISRTTRHRDGTICAFEQLTYQPLLDGRAWLVKERTLYFFDEGVTREPIEHGWRERHTTTVKNVVINEDIPDSIFSIELPAGTRVRDSTTPGRDGPAVEGHRIGFSIAILSGLVILVFIVLVVRRRFQPVS